MGRRWGPFGDLTVAREVAATVGGVAALRELLATSEPTVCCQRCRREVPIATTALSLLAQTSTDDPAEPGFIRVSFAHASCLPSLVVIDPDLADRQLDVNMATMPWRCGPCGLLGRPRRCCGRHLAAPTLSRPPAGNSATC
jgi:hypothetical protein